MFAVRSKVLIFVDGAWEVVWEGRSTYVASKSHEWRARGYKVRSCLA